MMTHYALAVLPGTHDLPDQKDIVSVCVDDMSVLLVKRPYRAILLPQSRKAVFQAAAARQVLLEAAMRFGPVLPFRPDVPMSPAQVAPFVRANRPLLSQLVQRFQGVVQFQVTVSWTAQDVLMRFRDSAELQPVFASGKAKPQVLEAAVTALAARLVGDMKNILADAGHEILLLPCADNMLLNAAVLVQSSDTEMLDHAIEKMDGIWTEGLQIKQIGPAPAASFATLDAHPIGPIDLARSRRLLSLDDAANGQEISAARRQALVRQPAQVEAIRKAADLLQAAVRSKSETCLLCSVMSDDQAARHFETNMFEASA